MIRLFLISTDGGRYFTEIEAITNPRVFKFLLEISGQKVGVDLTGIVKKFLEAELQDDNHVAVWAEIVQSCKKNHIDCIFVSTGEDVPKGYQYIATIKNSHGVVYHLYARADLECNT